MRGRLCAAFAVDTAGKIRYTVAGVTDMKKLEINDFTMRCRDRDYACRVPCSVYKTLLEYGAMDDPYVGENERTATGICDDDAVFSARFSLDDAMLTQDRLFLVFEGIDTLSDITLNGVPLASTDNMHRLYELDIKAVAQRENNLRVTIHSPNRYIAQKAARRHLYGVEHSMDGYQYLRKAHCMFGWDWGPKLPDMGIWRGVSVQGFSGGRIGDVYYTQRHEDGKVTLLCTAHLDIWTEDVSAELQVIAPDGKVFSAELQDGTCAVEIPEPRLWWVRGLGEQPLYTCRVLLKKSGAVLDEDSKKIGLRTLTISRAKDEWGEEFCFVNNGVKVFAMGGNYIPEDQIVTRCTKERTDALLNTCLAANYNFIRVWGGGYYPDDCFFDFCDENGLIVWQDFMFACAAYLLTPEFEATVRAEIRDNVLRLRHHASLGLWCGNNEIESAWAGWGWRDDPEAKADYLRLFEEIIPSVLRECDPETFYWPSSPSSGGGFNEPSSNHAGDSHYWAIWHSFRPIEDFRKHYFRFCSEYGFESLPDIKTVRSFAGDNDLDLCGNVMQMHQKCTQGNEKLMFYLAQMVNYPYDFERLIYCSQLLQADCIRSSVEHMRRARGRCMGSAYWQVNDSNPVISWSSVDYFGRWKALHYAARRFYAPLLLSCDDTDPRHLALYVTNDTVNDAHLEITCALRDHTARVLAAWRTEFSSPALSAAKALEIDLTGHMDTLADKRAKYLEYTLYLDGKAVSRGTTLFVRPKEFSFLPARMNWTVEERADCFALTFTSDVYAKSVCLSLANHDCVFSDNWFDLHGGEPVEITVPKDGLTLEKLQHELKYTNY